MLSTPRWPTRRWIVAAAVATAAALLIGIPTGIIRTPVYTRMTPVLWWNYPVWTATSILCGLIAATYVRSPLHAERAGKSSIGASVISLFAVGCPVCNKLVVMAVGVSGALNFWAPIQPILGVASLGVLLLALRSRLRGEQRCRVTASRPAI